MPNNGAMTNHEIGEDSNIGPRKEIKEYPESLTLRTSWEWRSWCCNERGFVPPENYVWSI